MKSPKRRIQPENIDKRTGRDRDRGRRKKKINRGTHKSEMAQEVQRRRGRDRVILRRARGGRRRVESLTSD